MDTKNKIHSLERELYNNYNVGIWQKIKIANRIIRKIEGDKRYLDYLKSLQKISLPPEYMTLELLCNQQKDS